MIVTRRNLSSAEDLTIDALVADLTAVECELHECRAERASYRELLNLSLAKLGQHEQLIRRQNDTINRLLNQRRHEQTTVPEPPGVPV